mmetsp:Transcript_19985/g.42059  ORF Transcript_19985/g.42059 Transcript_19985/m.42059 type:complete len:441 (+) Transcript_19985:169-1491(+)
MSKWSPNLMTLCIFVAVIWLFAVDCAAFNFPKIKFVGIPTKEDLNAPQRLVKKSPEDEENLRKSLEKYCNVCHEITSGDDDSKNASNNASFCWEPKLQESYEVADVIFQELAKVLLDRCNDNLDPSNKLYELVLSFPSMSRPDDLDKLSAVLQSDDCKQLLGLEDAFAELYPSSPAPYLRIILSESVAETIRDYQNDVPSVLLPSDQAKAATEDWVNNFLGKYRLCPYTSSVSRAAVGLSSVGVPVGGVHVRVECTKSEISQRQLKAAELVSSFWSEVVALIQSKQEEWATSLIVFPQYDDEFESFVNVCDKIVEPTVTATQATNYIGRAWFHPLYDADAVGHSEVIAGHAVPHKMVEGFMKSLSSSSGKGDQTLQYDELVKANNRVRQTPHATINILRRSQLTAAGEYEKGLGVKRPKANSIYVRNAARLYEVTKNTNI